MTELVLNHGKEKHCTQLAGWKWYKAGRYFLPDEGWKLHVSGNSSNAQQILFTVQRVLIKLKVAFKFLPTTGDVDNQTGVQRGKWLTIYPKNLMNAFTCVYMLDEALKQKKYTARSAPVISGERLVGESIIYTRYGGFSNDFVLSPSGRREKSKRGELKPSWIRDPWDYYEISGEINISKINSYQKWPKHPLHFHRG